MGRPSRPCKEPRRSSSSSSSLDAQEGGRRRTSFGEEFDSQGSGEEPAYVVDEDVGDGRCDSSWVGGWVGGWVG